MTIRASYFLAVVPLIAIVMRLASTPTANISYLIIAAYAMFGRVYAIQALTLSWLFSMLSPGIAAEATTATVGRYVVLFAAAISVLLRSGLLQKKMYITWPVLSTGFLGLFLIGHSVLFSPMSDVSMLKALSWLLAMTTLLAAWGGLSYDEREQLVGQIFRGLVLLMLLSLPLLNLPVGYLRNGTGFQGLMNHPQAFGPTMALLGAWSAGRMFALPKPPWKSIALVATCLMLVVLSEARTAGLAMVLGITVAVVLAPGLSGRSIRSLLPGLASRRFHLVIAVAVACSLVVGPILVERLGNYIVKRGHAQSLVEAYDTSRGRLIQEMWANVEKNPLEGIGFGIASDPYEMVVVRDPILNLPTGASIEKGVVPLAVLEELGVFGFTLFVLWIWMLLRRGARNGVSHLAVISTLLLINMGESTLFSPGGLGLLLMILLAWASTSNQKVGN